MDGNHDDPEPLAPHTQLFLQHPHLPPEGPKVQGGLLGNDPDMPKVNLYKLGKQGACVTLARKKLWAQEISIRTFFAECPTSAARRIKTTWRTLEEEGDRRPTRTELRLRC